MESVGQKLRQARLRLGLSLEDVSAKTRISVKSLQAIETDEPLRIGSAFLYRSFVRQFAEQVDLRYIDLAQAVQAATSSIPEPLIPGERQLSAPKLAPLREGRSKKLRWINSVASLIVMLGACSALYGMWQSSRSTFEASITSFVSSLTKRSHDERPAKGESGVAMKRSVVEVAQSVPPAAASASIESASDSAFRVELSALERTWLSIVDDGKQTFSGILQPRETKVLEGHDSARVRTGNAGGVNVVFNGKPLGTLGGRGQVRTVVFTKDSYEVLEPPVHIALMRFSLNGE